MKIFYNFEAFASFFYAIFSSFPGTDRDPAQRDAAPGFYDSSENYRAE